MMSILDYVIPAGAAKKYGASKLGVWGSIIGMSLGIFFFPPWGILLGGVAGALAGELISGTRGQKAFLAGWGIFVGYMISTVLKLAFSGVLFFFYIKKMF